MTYEEMISGFAEKSGIEGLSAEDGIASVSVDGTVVSIRDDREAQAAVVAAAIGEMPPDARGVFASLALQANFAAAGLIAICLNPATGELSAAASLPLAAADPDSLSAIVEKVVDTAAEWRRRTFAFSDIDEEAAAEDPEDDGLDPLSGQSGFIRV